MTSTSNESSVPPVDESTGISQKELRRRVARVRHDQTTGELVPFPNLDSEEALVDWLFRIETDLEDAGIPHAQWSDAAILFLDGPVNMAMRQLRQLRVQEELDLWPWDEFVTALLEVLSKSF
jgi:hypothetical protein